MNLKKSKRLTFWNGGSNTQFMTPTGRLGISPAGHRGTLPMFTFGATVPAGSAVFRNGHG